MQLEATRTAIKEFEATPTYTPEIKADAIAVLKAMTAQVVLRQAGAYDRLRVELSAKYDSQPAVKEYLRAIAYSYLFDIEEYAQDKLDKIQKRGVYAVA